MRVYLPCPCFIHQLIKYMQEALGRRPTVDQVRKACREIPEPTGEFSVEESREKELRYIDIEDSNE